MRFLIGFVLCLLFAACAVPNQDTLPQIRLPILRLAPSALGRDLALEQRLIFERGQQGRELDALLEVDTSQVRLLVQAMGQSAVRLVWDGQHLQERRAPWLPPQVSGERVLSDLQFALWPLSTVRAALPPDWRVEQTGDDRCLLDSQGSAWLTARSQGDLGNLRLHNLAEGYTLEVRSAPAQEDAP